MVERVVGEALAPKFDLERVGEVDTPALLLADEPGLLLADEPGRLKGMV